MTQAFNLSQFANKLNTSGAVDNTGLQNNSITINGSTVALGGSVTINPIPTGTLMLFQQTAAPTGWTKQTTHDNKALRVVSGTAGSGGSVGFTTAFGTPSVSGSVSATTLSNSQVPSHTYQGYLNNLYLAGGCNPPDAPSVAWASAGGPLNYWQPQWNNLNNFRDTNGGGSHTHSLSSATTTINVSYVDLIIAIKN